ncbi:MAG TPA: Tad domain-containing protein, partial [Dehalococcoidia bacterium]|nr:Tad domain-containing protein [Dehalococcoidia bacterium]
MSRTHRRSYRRGRLHAGEEGQALVLWALCLTVIIGMAGLVLDGSNLQNNRRKLQNAADAAAFAGAYRLPGSAGQATTDAANWLTKNCFTGVQSCADASDTVVTNAVSTTSVTNDTI